MDDDRDKQEDACSNSSKPTEPTAESTEDIAPNQTVRSWDEAQIHQTCPSERYMIAKFTLSAYIFCWAVLKLCQVKWLNQFPAITPFNVFVCFKWISEIFHAT